MRARSSKEKFTAGKTGSGKSRYKKDFIKHPADRAQAGEGAPGKSRHKNFPDKKGSAGGKNAGDKRKTADRSHQEESHTGPKAAFINSRKKDFDPVHEKNAAKRAGGPDRRGKTAFGAAPGKRKPGNKPGESAPPFFEQKRLPVKHERLKPGEGKSKLPKYDPTRGKEQDVSKGEEMPLNKYIAHCGICSRRKAVDYIREGKVTVNGEAVTEPAFKVTKSDAIVLSGRKISLQQNSVYVLLNKPKGFITTTDDPEGRRTVMELVQDAANERIFPVGRLDRNTSGLLLLTNDGELAQKLSHPKHNTKKVYHVGLDKPLTKADFEKIVQGVELEDGVALVDGLAFADDRDKAQIGIEIHSGKNRIVRRIFEELGYKVDKLDRVLYAGLTKKNIPRGKWRFLTEKEVILLKHFK